MLSKDNPFQKGHPTYLVYRSKIHKDDIGKAGRWRTFGFYDSLMIEYKPNVTYKDCFAIRFPSAFKDRHLLGKQVFTLLPFPEDDPPKKSILLDASTEDGDPLPALPFLGIVMVEMNMLQDESGDPADYNYPLAYMDKLKAYRGRAENVLKRNKAEDESISIMKNKLSFGCQYETMLSTNCADLCIVMRTARIEDIYLATKLIRIHFSLSDQQEQSSPRLCYQPQINTIAAMSTSLDDYGSFENIRKQNNGMAVDFRLSCNSTSAEETLLKCCKFLMWDEPRSKTNREKGIYPGERIGGVLGVGQYSIHMPLLNYLDLYFDWRGFLRRPRSVLAYALFDSVHPNPKETDYTISNVRLRFCNNADLVKFEKEEQERVKYLSFLPKNQEFTEIEKFLVVLRKELSLYRNQIHFSAYMLKEALSMINDLYYTYNDLLYEENVHSYILATQLLALSGNTLKYLRRIVDEINGQKDALADPAAAGRRPIIDAVDQLIEMVHVVVLSINSYNKSIVSHSQANLNYPNYEIQSKVNIEKYQVAYTAFVQRLCDLFPSDDQYCKNPTLAYVYLNLNEDETNATQSFAVHPFHVQKGKVHDARVGNVRMLPIASPNYRRFAHMHHMLPQLCHELGHHLRFLKRDERNKNVYSYLLEPVANQVAEQVIEYATASSVFFGSLDEARAMLRCIIQRVLLDEMYDSLDINRSGSYELEKLPFSVLKLPIGDYLFQQLNYEQSSFNRFWNGYRDLLGLASEASRGKIRVYGADAPSSDEVFPETYRYLYPVNLTISALNSFLVTKCDYFTGYEQQGWAFASLWENWKESWREKAKIGWRQLVFTLMDSGKRTNMDISILISVVLSLSSGTCSALMDSFFLPEEEVRQLPKEYKEVWTGFGTHYLLLLYTLFFYVSDDVEHPRDFTEQVYEPLSAASQNDQIKKAEYYCSQMRAYADELNRIPGLSAAHSRHARRVSAACTEMQRVVNVLHFLMQEQSMLWNIDSSHSAPNAIPIVTDRSANRIEKIMLRLRRCLASQAVETGVRLDPNLASRLQNESDCRRWLSAAFRILNPKACMTDAGRYYDLYNEVTADLAMCAAMQFTPFGYLAYTEHQFAERPEQVAYDAFSAVRVRDVVVTLLSVNANAERNDCSGESLEKTYVCALEKLSKSTSDYLTKVNKAYISLIQKVIGKPALANLFPKEIDRNALIPQQMPDQDVRQCGSWVEQRIWDVDKLALALREYYNNLNDDKYSGNSSYKEERKAVQEILESTTDLLGHLRTLKRIYYMMNQIPETPPKQSPWVDCFPSNARPLSLMEHYRMLWYAMNTEANDNEAFQSEIRTVFGVNAKSAFEDEVRNQWIKKSKCDETLIAISDHYNHYYKRPGADRNDEHLDQVHFVLRYYWDGNLRYRRLSRLCPPDFDWKKKKEDGSTDWEQVIKDWFTEWKKRPEEAGSPAERKEEQG